LPDTTPQTINNWEQRGISKKGMLDAQRAIGCSATWLESGDGPMQTALSARIEISESPDVAIAQGSVAWKIPLISWGQAAALDRSDGQSWIAEKWIAVPGDVGPRAYALRVTGDSMLSPGGKSYPAGSIIVVDPDQKMPTSGQLVIARLTGAMLEPTFKVYRVDILPALKDGDSLHRRSMSRAGKKV